MAAKSDGNARVVAHNRKADQLPDQRDLRAGIALTGTEVEGAARGKATMRGSYAGSAAAGIWLVNANIPEYLQAGRFNHAPKRIRTPPAPANPS